MAKRGPARFKETDLARAVRAAREAGGVERVEIARDGTINVILARNGESGRAKTDEDGEDNSWTEEIAKLKAKAAK